MTQEAFREIAPTIPQQPGVYKYFNRQGEIIYVGKAKDLRKRVSSYFNKTVASYKTHELVQRIHRMEFTVVDTEQDALFLENALIKEYQPRFNIDLKDDKSYPYIVIKKEPFPRVFLTRRKINDGSEYLGPFTSVARVREMLDFIKQHVQLRTCKLPLTDKNIQAKKFRVCLEYHLGNCKAPCVGMQSQLDYLQGLTYLKQLLRGRLTDIMAHYKAEQQEAIANLAFEKAALIQKKIDHLEQYSSRSVIVSQQLGDIDVFSILKDGELAYVNYLMVRNGTIVQTHTLQLQPHLDETENEVLAFGVQQIRDRFDSTALEILVPVELEYADERVKVSTGKTGERKKLLDLSIKNVLIYRDEIRRKKMLKTEEKTDEDRDKLLMQVKNDLSLPEVPVHIECFDNSNFQGSYPVSAMVCFKNGLPSKNDYRRFHVKTVQGINDFASMEEAVYRRYKRLHEEKLPMPQLVIIDGGKGQLGAALQAVQKLGITGSFTMVGLAKNEEELFFPGDTESLKLNWNSESLKFIRRIRDEVHRFGITFHRQQRSKGTFRNELENINGIGKTTATALLKQLKSVKKISGATQEELAAIIGTAKANIVFNYFNALQTEVPKNTQGTSH
ncbi:MAG: excinuclease ABC subunit UvrC [Chitinophagaceae bacterium]|jgi:excinuclease ABC subunit C|nr:excinuclease ABC subunit UvrC [Chitinophagaceae bacterium]